MNILVSQMLIAQKKALLLITVIVNLLFLSSANLPVIPYDGVSDLNSVIREYQVRLNEIQRDGTSRVGNLQTERDGQIQDRATAKGRVIYDPSAANADVRRYYGSQIDSATSETSKRIRELDAYYAKKIRDILALMDARTRTQVLAGPFAPPVPPYLQMMIAMNGANGTGMQSLSMTASAGRNRSPGKALGLYSGSTPTNAQSRGVNGSPIAKAVPAGGNGIGVSASLNWNVFVEGGFSGTTGVTNMKAREQDYRQWKDEIAAMVKQELISRGVPACDGHVELYSTSDRFFEANQSSPTAGSSPVNNQSAVPPFNNTLLQVATQAIEHNPHRMLCDGGVSDYHIHVFLLTNTNARHFIDLMDDPHWKILFRIPQR